MEINNNQMLKRQVKENSARRMEKSILSCSKTRIGVPYDKN